MKFAEQPKYCMPKKTFVAKKAMQGKCTTPLKKCTSGIFSDTSSSSTVSWNMTQCLRWENPPTTTTSALGVHYYGYRYYSSDLGRWVSRDPIEESGGLNIYGFVGNDCIDNIDLLGFFTDSLFMHGRLEGPSMDYTATSHLSGRCGELSITIKIDADHREGVAHNFNYANHDPRIYAKRFVGVFVDFTWDGGHSWDCAENQCCCDEAMWRQYVTTERVWVRDPVDISGINCLSRLKDSPGILLDKLGWFENVGGDSFVSYIDSFSCGGEVRRDVVIYWNYSAARKTHNGPWTVAYWLNAYMDYSD